MATETSFGTKYLPLDCYEAVKGGALQLKKGVAEVPGKAASEADLKAAFTPKAAVSRPTLTGEQAKFVPLFVSIGLSEIKAAETAKNGKLAADLAAVIESLGSSVSRNQGVLALEVATKLQSTKWLRRHRDFLLPYLADERIKTKVQLEGALKFLSKLLDTNYDAFDAAAGVGIDVTAEEIKAAIAKVVADSKADLESKRYKYPIGRLLGAAKAQGNMKWADGKAVKGELDAQIEALLGPRTEADNAKPAKTKGKKEKKDKSKAAGKDEEELVTFSGAAAGFHLPGHNYETEGYIVTPNTKALLAKHLKETGGIYVTRFPPEPNGILHIGHAKAINFNFAFARDRGGKTFLRYDDTNPEAEEEEFFVGIRRDVEWLLGPKPWCGITHSSDYFDQLHEFAIKLIRDNKAYVCHQQVEEIRGHEDKAFSPWRERPIEESLLLFDDMRNGKMEEGEATLRLKHVMKDGKVDPVAYRVKYAHHAKSGDKWCIYPTYDYTHCICDSLENISHSLCTKEFQNRRPSYYWLCNALDIYCPVQWEYARLNISHTVVSKRKIGRLINAGFVRGWDDPRLFTLSALRRRGFPAEAVNDFCNKLGVTGATSLTDPKFLEAVVRDHLNRSARRVMAVVAPLKVVVDDFRKFPCAHIEMPNNPVDDAAGTRTAPLCKVLYIERDDFSETDIKGFRRLTPKQTVGLKHAGLVLTVTEVIKTAGEIVEVHVSGAELTPDNKPKAFIHWVSSARESDAPQSVEVRKYSRLFNVERPSGKADEVNPDSEEVVAGALVDCGVEGASVGDRFQFERLGYFCVDKDTSPGKLVFNETIALKEDKSKK